YQDLPEELIITPMRVHQRYFATRHKDGTLAPFFMCVAGTETVDGGKRVIQGNEMVLRARLADARFFFETDKKILLEQRTQALSQQIFHHRLGTVAERLPRLQAWGRLLQNLFQKEACFREVRLQDRERAVTLCKTDLGTEAVKEFPELQGIMGGYYAALQGESPAVAIAIQEHYRPQGVKDAVPETPLGVLLALADKWEMIWSLFQIEERPTGSKDPFALRRAAFGIIRILETHHLSLNLAFLFQQYAPPGAETVAAACISFFKERLRGRLKDMGISVSVSSALLEQQEELDIWRVIERAPLLQTFLGTPEGEDLLQGYRRLTHILQSLPKEEGVAPLTPSLFTTPEQTLHQALGVVQQAASFLGESIADFQKYLTLLATLRPPLDAFFEGVLVACPDPTLRRNRQALLEAVRSCYEHLCAFSYLEGA
ncbi:MAG: glycine--tRNA ligase subunit beta, partial [Holosporales bacterium]|nr:glycine--tRNA ligase subunit beta [Holosporales bacterium]